MYCMPRWVNECLNSFVVVAVSVITTINDDDANGMAQVLTIVARARLYSRTF